MTDRQPSSAPEEALSARLTCPEPESEHGDVPTSHGPSGGRSAFPVEAGVTITPETAPSRGLDAPESRPDGGSGDLGVPAPERASDTRVELPSVCRRCQCPANSPQCGHCNACDVVADPLPIIACPRTDQHGYHMWPARPDRPAFCPGHPAPARSVEPTDAAPSHRAPDTAAVLRRLFQRVQAAVRRAHDGSLRDQLALAPDTPGEQRIELINEPDDTDLTEADIDRMAAEGEPVQLVAPPSPTHGAHRCGNCEGHDPDTCLFNPGPVTDDASLRRAVYRILNVESEFVGCPSATTDRIMDVIRPRFDQQRAEVELTEADAERYRKAAERWMDLCHQARVELAEAQGRARIARSTWGPVPAEIKAIVDRAAGKDHSAGGAVMRCLQDVLAAHRRMLTEQAEAAIERVRKAVAERRAEVAEYEAENPPSAWSDAVTVTCDRIDDALRPRPEPQGIPDTQPTTPATEEPDRA